MFASNSTAGQVMQKRLEAGRWRWAEPDPRVKRSGKVHERKDCIEAEQGTSVP